jgi:hypothetical protein
VDTKDDVNDKAAGGRKRKTIHRVGGGIQPLG